MVENLHERLGEEEALKLPSERSFGITFVVVFALIGLFPLLHGGNIRLWALAICLITLLITLATPFLLRPLNDIWMRFALLLHRLTNPIVLGLLFVLVVIPIAFFVRLTGGVLLSPTTAPESGTYWITRKPPGPDPQSMRNQF